MTKRKIAVIGAGAWGTSLALLACKNGHQVTLWARDEKTCQEINNSRTNNFYLPEHEIPESLNATSSFMGLQSPDLIIMATPAQNLRDVLKKMQENIQFTMPVVIASKGIEQGSLKTVSEIASEFIKKDNIAVLSGPNFADEVAKGLPAATVIASTNMEISKIAALTLMNSRFRVYPSDDIIGVELGGAIKNVIAIACGITIGKKLGENSRAALITRGLAEMARAVKAKGGKLETVTGLSGSGDLTLTCSSPKSRNMSLGIALGEGKPLKDILNERLGKVTEGLTTAQSVKELSDKLKVEMPICEAVYDILYNHKNIDTVIKNLLERPLRPEF